MLELHPLRIGLVRVLARAEVIDALTEDDSSVVLLRLNSTEALLVCDPADESHVLERVRTQLARTEPTAVAVADSDSFSGWTLVGSNADDGFSRLSAIPLPEVRPACVQGLVAHIPAKVLAGPERLIILVSSTLEHHFHARVHDACRVLGLVEREPATFPPELPAEVVT